MKNKLQHKLFESGLIEKGNTDDINAFKKAYKTDYDQAFNKQYKAKTEKVRLTFTIEEKEYLKDLAKIFKMPLATMLKVTIFAYHNGTYIHLEREKFEHIEDYHREMERRISEIVRHIHTSAEITTSDIEHIKMIQDEFTKLIIQKLENPPRLEEWLENHIEKDEMFLSKLLRSIAYYLNP